MKPMERGERERVCWIQILKLDNSFGFDSLLQSRKPPAEHTQKERGVFFFFFYFRKGPAKNYLGNSFFSFFFQNGPVKLLFLGITNKSDDSDETINFLPSTRNIFLKTLVGKKSSRKVSGRRRPNTQKELEQNLCVCGQQTSVLRHVVIRPDEGLSPYPNSIRTPGVVGKKGEGGGGGSILPPPPLSF